MRLLDKYLLKEYLKLFILIALAFSVLFIVIDIFDHMPRLLRRGASILQMLYYFGLRLPYLAVLTSPVVVLLAGLFLMNNLSKHNESIAIRAAGISIVRMIVPLLIFGTIFSGFILFFGDRVLPWAEYQRKYLMEEKIKKRKIEDVKMRSDIHYYGKDNYFYFIGFFDGYRKKLKTVDIAQFDPENGKLKRRIIATTAEWIDDKLIFKNCSIQDFSKPGTFTSETYEEKYLPEIDITPVDFVKSAKKPMQMNYHELKDYIKRLQKIGENPAKFQVDLHQKISFPFANLIILLFSVPLATVSVRSRGRGLIFLIGLLICFIFLGSLRFSQSLGYNEILSPVMAAWLPNIIFAVIGIFFVIKAEV